VSARAWHVALVCAGLVFGCASPRERLYTLSGTEPPDVVRPPTLHLLVGPVTIPETVDRPQLVVRRSAVRLVALEQERWAEPLREAIPRVLSEAIRAELPAASVTSLASVSTPQWDMRVFVDVTRFDAIPGERVIIETHWRLQRTGDQTAQEGNIVARVTVQGAPQDYDALVAAEAAGLAKIGVQLARVIETEAAQLTNP